MLQQILKVAHNLEGHWQVLVSIELMAADTRFSQFFYFVYITVDILCKVSLQN